VLYFNITRIYNIVYYEYERAINLSGKDIEQICKAFNNVRKQNPLVHNITNLVVTNITANALLAVGASPVMANAPEEVAEMAGIASALVLNIGTLETSLIESMIIAGQAANRKGIPVLLDPVGAGATSMRTKSAMRILNDVKINILRGNASEISIIGGFGGEVKGVDSAGSHEDLGRKAAVIARQFGTVVAITGATDFISDGKRIGQVNNGHKWLTAITGSGCMASAVMGAFAAVQSDCFMAAVSALSCYGTAAELAAPRAAGPGSFQVALFDSLYNLSEKDLAGCIRVQISEI